MFFIKAKALVIPFYQNIDEIINMEILLKINKNMKILNKTLEMIKF